MEKNSIVNQIIIKMKTQNTKIDLNDSDEGSDVESLDEALVQTMV